MTHTFDVAIGEAKYLVRFLAHANMTYSTGPGSYETVQFKVITTGTDEVKLQAFVEAATVSRTMETERAAAR